MTPVPTIYLARHGETEWSKDGRHTGRTDIPLTPQGELDGRKLGERLKGLGLSFDRAFSSPLSRARCTAELAGFTPEIEPDLIEWSYGQYEGRTSSQIRSLVPSWNLFLDGCPGGESPEEIAARGDRLARKLKGLTGNVICFAHGHILRVLAARWIGQPVTLAGGLLLGTANLSILSFDHNDPNEPAIKMWNS
ncbi:MAG TPA: histidine phosphatase family protein [Gemmata sp.]|nr:histidine phosphatase family protein [Gemmata sp.]